MKKKRGRRGLKPLNVRPKGGGDGKPHEIVSGKRGTKGPKRKKALPPWREVRRPPICEGCGLNRSDPPSKLCPGCQAYREHQA